VDVRQILIIIVALFSSAVCSAAEIGFSLKIDEISLTPRLKDPGPRPDPRTEARLAQWNSPMGRLMHNFHQQQAWIMRGTMPGGERVTGAAVSVTAQNGLPLRLIATSTRAAIDISEREIAVVRWPWDDDRAPPVMALDEQLSVLLGRRLTER
jgi:hypothetical protein